MSPRHHHSLGKVACEYSVLTKPNQVVAVPALRFLDVKLGRVRVLVQRLAQRHTLAVDTNTRSGIDVGLGPRDVSVAVIANAVPSEHLGLGQVGDISRAAKAPERQPVADVGVAATVLKVELIVHGDLPLGSVSLPKDLLARRFKFAAEDLGGTLDILVSILKPEAEIQVRDPIQLEEHTAAHPQRA